jgi:hypothetical protein
MRLILPLLAYLSTGALASPINLSSQDTVIIERAVQDATVALQRLDTTISQYTRRPRDNPGAQQRQVDEDSAATIEAFSRGASRMKSVPQLTHNEGRFILPKVNALVFQIQSTIGGTMVGARSIIVYAGGQRPVVDSLMKQQSAAAEFAKTLISKMPTGDAAGGLLQLTTRNEYDKAIRRLN